MDLIENGFSEYKQIIRLKKAYISEIQKMGWDGKPPFEYDPLKFIGGAAKLWAEKRQSRMLFLTFKL